MVSWGCQIFPKCIFLPDTHQFIGPPSQWMATNDLFDVDDENRTTTMDIGHPATTPTHHVNDDERINLHSPRNYWQKIISHRPLNCVNVNSPSSSRQLVRMAFHPFNHHPFVQPGSSLPCSTLYCMHIKLVSRFPS